MTRHKKKLKPKDYINWTPDEEITCYDHERIARAGRKRLVKMMENCTPTTRLRIMACIVVTDKRLAAWEARNG